MILKDLLNINEYPYKQILDDQIDISGITFDSRLVHPGYIFFAFPGTNTDGHLYIKKSY